MNDAINIDDIVNLTNQDIDNLSESQLMMYMRALEESDKYKTQLVEIASPRPGLQIKAYCFEEARTISIGADHLVSISKE